MSDVGEVESDDENSIWMAVAAIPCLMLFASFAVADGSKD
jgi:hypothetical protein